MPTIDDVRAFTKRKHSDYLHFLEGLQAEIRRFKDIPRFNSSIYRIYSRADKQAGGAFMKTDFKIAKKLDDWRRKTPDMAPSDIHDIIGITVVTYFSSQVDSISQALARKKALKDFRVVSKKPKSDDGYHAIHIVFESVQPVFIDILCEVQIKTLLHDGWAAKTHDLTYKPERKINKYLDKQMKILGDSVQLLEKQSDIIRTVIEKEWSQDKKRRNLAQMELLQALIVDPILKYDPDVISISANIKKEIATLRDCDQSDRTLLKYISVWRKLVDKKGYDRSSCRLITFIACIRDAHDLNNVALDAIDQWVTSASEGEQRGHALVARSLANYTFGIFDSAVEDAERALSYALKHSLPVAGLSMNLAYFLTEESYNSGIDMPDDKLARVHFLLKEAEPAFIGQRFSKFLDTKGSVKIASGRTESEVREGLALCRQALDLVERSSQDKPAAEAFYRLHEQRACRRLLEWE